MIWTPRTSVPYLLFSSSTVKTSPDAQGIRSSLLLPLGILIETKPVTYKMALISSNLFSKRDGEKSLYRSYVLSVEHYF
jgi:hypothetical protein